MEMLQNTFIINNKQIKKQCINTINNLNIEANYEVCVFTSEKMKTKKQCALFYSILNEFVKINHESGFDNEIYKNNVGWWKYFIKKLAHFYDTRKGCLFNEKRSKEIDDALNKLPEDIKNDIVEAMIMNVKSISEANTTELSNLINNLLTVILSYQTPDNILSSELLSKVINQKYNNIMNAKYTCITNEEYIIQLLCEENFYIENNNGRYYLSLL